VTKSSVDRLSIQLLVPLSVRDVGRSPSIRCLRCLKVLSGDSEVRLYLFSPNDRTGSHVHVLAQTRSFGGLAERTFVDSVVAGPADHVRAAFERDEVFKVGPTDPTTDHSDVFHRLTGPDDVARKLVFSNITIDS